jgi:two-component system response regulator HydG
MSPDPPRRILIVDDDASHRRMLGLVLSNHGFDTVEVPGGAEALGRFAAGERYDFVLLDMRMPRIDGMATLREIQRRRHDTRVILLTAYAEVRAAVEAIKLGAVDYLSKPLDVNELLALMDKVRPPATSGLPSTASREKTEETEETAPPGRFGMIGRSSPMKELYGMIEQVAPSEATVLITGPSGTGKELAAAAIHNNGPRGAGPMLSVNCAALPEPLLESELFGHVRGAFTGAERDRSGRFELANGGTLFLDEIGDMPATAQAKILRVLQEGVFEPVGSSQSRRVDVRIIVATNKDLTREVEEGRFREDLFYRLNIVAIHVPPLRERKEDIPELANHFIAVYAERNRKEIGSAQGEFLQRLSRHDWPGNVRELENTIERCVILALSDELTVDLLPPNIRGLSTEEQAPPAPRDETIETPLMTLQDAERELILRTLEACQGNQSWTARRLGISRQTLINRLKQYRAREGEQDTVGVS